MLTSLSVLGKSFKTIRRNLLSKKFEPEIGVLNRFVSQGDICFDVGASYGRYAYALSRLVGPDGKIYCFEPGQVSYGVLRNTIRFHRLKNVLPFKIALSDKKDEINLVVPLKKGSSNREGLSLAYISHVQPEHAKIEKIQTITLDDFCQERHINRLNFIKCDVEGGELWVLKGARKSLEKFKPTLLFEVNDAFLRDKFETTAESILNFIEDLGYKAMQYRNGDFLEADKILKNDNYFFIHKTRMHYLKLGNRHAS